MRIQTLDEFIKESLREADEIDLSRAKKTLKEFLVWLNDGKAIPDEVTPNSDVIVNWAEATDVGDSKTHVEPSQAYELYSRFGDDIIVFNSEKEAANYKISYNLGTLGFVTIAAAPAFKGKAITEDINEYEQWEYDLEDMIFIASKTRDYQELADWLDVKYDTVAKIFAKDRNQNRIFRELVKLIPKTHEAMEVNNRGTIVNRDRHQVLRINGPQYLVYTKQGQIWLSENWPKLMKEFQKILGKEILVVEGINWKLVQSNGVLSIPAMPAFTMEDPDWVVARQKKLEDVGYSVYYYKGDPIFINAEELSQSVSEQNSFGSKMFFNEKFTEVVTE